jgi:flagellin-like hook-associated protein FlgL
LEQKGKIAETIKVKVIQAAQDGQSEMSRKIIQKDINKLRLAMNEIDNSMKYNDKALVSGGFVNQNFQVGTDTKDIANLFVGSTNSSDIGHTSYKVIQDLPVDQISPFGKVNLKLKAIDGMSDVNIDEISMGVDTNQGLGALATAINKVKDKTGIIAVAETIHSTDKPLKGGTTPSDFSINGIKIGQVTFEDGDRKNHLQWAINKHQSQHGVNAYTDQTGTLFLQSDGRMIDIQSDSLNILSSLNIISTPTNSSNPTGIEEFDNTTSEEIIGQYIDSNGNCQNKTQTVISGEYENTISTDVDKQQLFEIPAGVTEFQMDLTNFGGANGDDILWIGDTEYTNKTSIDRNDLGSLPTTISITNKNAPSILDNNGNDISGTPQTINAGDTKTFTIPAGTTLETFDISGNYDPDTVTYTSNGTTTTTPPTLNTPLTNEIIVTINNQEAQLNAHEIPQGATTIDSTIPNVNDTFNVDFSSGGEVEFYDNTGMLVGQLDSNGFQLGFGINNSDFNITGNNGTYTIDANNSIATNMKAINGADAIINSPVTFDNSIQEQENLLATIPQGITEVTLDLSNYQQAGDADSLRVDNATLTIDQTNQTATITNITADTKLYATDVLPIVELRQSTDIDTIETDKIYTDDDDITTSSKNLFYIPKAVKSTTIDLTNFGNTQSKDILKIGNITIDSTTVDKTQNTLYTIGNTKIEFNPNTSQVTINDNDNNLLVSATDGESATNFTNITNKTFNTSALTDITNIPKGAENITFTIKNFGFEDDALDQFKIINTTTNEELTIAPSETDPNNSITGITTLTQSYNSSNRTTTITLDGIDADLQIQGLNNVVTNTSLIKLQNKATNGILTANTEQKIYDMPWRVDSATTTLTGWNGSDKLIERTTLGDKILTDPQWDNTNKNYYYNQSSPTDSSLTKTVINPQQEIDSELVIEVGVNHATGTEPTLSNGENWTTTTNSDGSKTFNWNGMINSGDLYVDNNPDDYIGASILDSVPSNIKSIILQVNGFELGADDVRIGGSADVSYSTFGGQGTITITGKEDNLDIGSIIGIHSEAYNNTGGIIDSFSIIGITATEYPPLELTSISESYTPQPVTTSTTSTMDGQTNHFGIEVGTLEPHVKNPLAVTLSSWTQEPITLNATAQPSEPLEISASYKSGASSGMDAGFPITAGKLKLINIASSSTIEVAGTGLNLIGLDPNNNKSTNYTKTLDDIAVNMDRDHIEDSINIIDSTIQQIDNVRSDVGSFLNKMVSHINVLSQKIVNTEHSQSQIRDADISEEMAKFKKADLFYKTGSYLHGEINKTNTQNAKRVLNELQ